MQAAHRQRILLRRSLLEVGAERSAVHVEKKLSKLLRNVAPTPFRAVEEEMEHGLVERLEVTRFAR
jgi:hypothetical protein